MYEVFRLSPPNGVREPAENRLFSPRGGADFIFFCLDFWLFTPHVAIMLAFVRQNNQVTPNFFTLRFMALADPSPVNIFLKHSTNVGHYVGHFII